VVIPRLTAADAEDMVQSGAVSGGMMVKVRQALVAASAGVEVRIGGGDLLDDPEAGTRIVPSGAPAEPAEALP